MYRVLSLNKVCKVTKLYKKEDGAIWDLNPCTPIDKIGALTTELMALISKG